MFHIDQLCCSGKKQVGVHCWKKRKCKQLGIFQVPVGVEPVWFIYFNIPIPERQYRRHRAIVAKTGLVSHIRCIVHFLATDSPQFCIVESMEKHAIKNSCIWVRFPITINYILFQRQGTDTTLCSASEGLHGRQTSVLRPRPHPCYRSSSGISAHAQPCKGIESRYSRNRRLVFCDEHRPVIVPQLLVMTKKLILGSKTPLGMAMHKGREGPGGRASVCGSLGPRRAGPNRGGVRGHRPPLTTDPPWGTARPTLAACPAPSPGPAPGAPRPPASPAPYPAHQRKPHPPGTAPALLTAPGRPRPSAGPGERRLGPGAAPPRPALAPPPREPRPARRRGPRVPLPERPPPPRPPGSLPAPSGVRSCRRRRARRGAHGAAAVRRPRPGPAVGAGRRPEPGAAGAGGDGQTDHHLRMPLPGCRHLRHRQPGEPGLDQHRRVRG